MQTCRHCLSADIPDGATHCRHCGRRLKPSKAPIVVIIIIVVAALLAWGISATRSANQRDFDRAQLKMEMDSMKETCSPTSPQELLDVETAAFNKHLEKSSLDADEQRNLS